MNRYRHSCRWGICFLVLWVFGAGFVQAETIPKAYQEAGLRAGISPVVLYSIALVESRKRTPTGSTRPWPWTLNIQGEPYFFESREAALARIESTLAEGITDFGVGVMQVHWSFHHHRFDSDPAKALDPYENLNTGAAILAEYWRDTGSLWQAVGRYHSATPDLAQAYQRRFAEKLTNLLAADGGIESWLLASR